MSLYDEWCDQGREDKGLKRYLTFAEKDGGRSAIIKDLGKTVRVFSRRHPSAALRRQRHAGPRPSRV